MLIHIPEDKSEVAAMRESKQEALNKLTRPSVEVYAAIDDEQPCTTDDLATVMKTGRGTIQKHCLTLFNAGVVDRGHRDRDNWGGNVYEYTIAGEDSGVYKPPEPPATSPSPWRLRCPKGHSSLTVFEEMYECDACDGSYYGEPFDAKTTEFPVDGVGMRDKTVDDEVLAELIRICDLPTRSRVRAQEFEVGTPNQVGARLAALEDDGLVSRIGNGNKGHHWKPTAKGVQRVRQLESDESPDRARAQVTPLDTVKLFAAVAAIAILVMVLGGVFL